jgi:hypothetical protein
LRQKEQVETLKLEQRSSAVKEEESRISVLREKYEADVKVLKLDQEQVKIS